MIDWLLSDCKFCVCVLVLNKSSFYEILKFGILKVNWYPWGEEAFEEARKRDVPIFLSSIVLFIVETTVWLVSVVILLLILVLSDACFLFACGFCLWNFYVSKLDTAPAIGEFLNDATREHLLRLPIIGRKILISCWPHDRCHVMEVESFEDEDIAKLLNDWFVSIKVGITLCSLNRILRLFTACSNYTKNS